MIANPDNKQALQLYVAISLALALPLLLWPFAWLSGGWPDTGSGIHHRWLAAAICLLMAGVVADTILSGMCSNRQILTGTVWIVLVSQVAGLAMHAPAGVFLIAGLFGLHALRAAIPLWRGEKAWWLWPAWVRDTGSALVLFSWMIILRHG